MIKKMSIRLRITALSVLLLTVCCVGLTITLNFSANRMADVIEAVPVRPAAFIPESGIMTQTDAIALEPLQNTQVARDRFQYQSIIYMMLIVIIGGCLTYYITGRALDPLQELSSKMKNCTVFNLSEELIVPQSHDEIADLTDSFNEMSRKLNEAFAMQKRFSQSAAHELRTPLTVLKTKVDVFKKKKSHTQKEYDDLLSVITTHTDRLAELVKNLLDLTTMDSLECEEEIELKSLLHEIKNELLFFAKEKCVIISVEGEEKNIVGNKILLHRAFYNIVENAIKYNVESGTVKIIVSNEDTHGCVVVADTGIGISPEAHTLIFEPFFRVDKSRSRQIGGAGLGLSTVKAIIEKHAGEITVSDGITNGTVFTITL